jgi:large subunit ribosomal protein L31e
MSESETKEEEQAPEEEEEKVEEEAQAPTEAPAPVEEPTATEEVEITPAETETAETVPAAQEEEAEGEGEEEIEVVEEKIYTIPLRHVHVVTPRGRRAPRAVRDVRDFVARHMKAEEVAMSNEVNNALWARSINKPPRKITVRAVKDKEGKVIVYPAKAA